MTSPKIVIASSIIYAAQLPEKPEEPDTVDGCSDFEYEWDNYERKLISYEQRLASALKPENMVRFEENTKIIMLKDRESFQEMFDVDNIINGEYKVPPGYEIVTQWQFKHDYWKPLELKEVEAFEELGYETRQVAILRKVEEKKEDEKQTAERMISEAKLDAAYWAGRMIDMPSSEMAWDIANEIATEINEWRTCFETEKLLAQSYKKELDQRPSEYNKALEDATDKMVEYWKRTPHDGRFLEDLILELSKLKTSSQR